VAGVIAPYVRLNPSSELRPCLGGGGGLGCPPGRCLGGLVVGGPVPPGRLCGLRLRYFGGVSLFFFFFLPPLHSARFWGGGGRLSCPLGRCLVWLVVGGPVTSVSLCRLPLKYIEVVSHNLLSGGFVVFFPSGTSQKV